MDTNYGLALQWILLCNKREQTVNIRYNLDDCQRLLLSEKSISKGYILYDLPYLTVLKETKLWGRIKRQLQKVMLGEKEGINKGVY